MSLICSYVEGWCFIGTFPTKQKLLSPERGLHTNVLPINFQRSTYMVTITAVHPFSMVSFQVSLDSGTYVIISHQIPSAVRKDIIGSTHSHVKPLHLFVTTEYSLQKKEQDFGCDLALYVILHMVSSILNHCEFHTTESLDLRSFNGTNTRCNARRWHCALRKLAGTERPAICTCQRRSSCPQHLQ